MQQKHLQQQQNLEMKLTSNITCPFTFWRRLSSFRTQIR